MIVKTCGLREPENIEAISALGVDWIGLIFYPKSPRFIGEQANLQAFLQQAEKGEGSPKRVGVFVNAEFKDILEAVQDYELDYVQLHGGESAVYCATLQQLWKDSSIRKARIIRAFRVSRAFDFGITIDYEPYCDYFLFDTKGQEYGGTGHKFDWTILDRYTGKTPFLLSGGIGPGDAPSVKSVSHPALAGVDLNSKFEIEPGLKDVQELAKFLGEL